MTALRTRELLPKQLPVDVEVVCTGFFEQFRALIAAPLVACERVEQAEGMMDDVLMQGAILRYRWLELLDKIIHIQDIIELVDFISTSSVRKDLLKKAEGLFNDRSFLFERAIARIVDGILRPAFSFDVLQKASDQQAAVVLAGTLETAAPRDVLGLFWLMVLLEDVARPTPPVFQYLLETLLLLTKEHEKVCETVGIGNLPKQIPDEKFGFSTKWFVEHPGLAMPFHILRGLVLSEPEVVALVIEQTSDPEIKGFTWLQFHIHVRAEDYEQVRYRIENRALRAGILGNISDDTSAMVLMASRVQDESR